MAPLLASPKLSDAGTLVASSQVSTFEAANLQSMSPSLTWRSTNLTPYLVGNLGGAKTIRFVSLCYATAKVGTTWRVRFATSEANLTAAPSYDSGSISFWPGGADLSAWATTHSRLYLATEQTVTWYRIDIDHSASGASSFDAARLVVAEGIDFAEFARATVTGSLQVQWAEEVVEVEDQGGEEMPRPRRVVGSLGPIKVIGLSDAEAYGKLAPFLRDRGTSKDWMIVSKPAENVYPMDFMMLGRKKTAHVFDNTFAGWSETELALREV